MLVVLGSVHVYQRPGRPTRRHVEPNATRGDIGLFQRGQAALEPFGLGTAIGITECEYRAGRGGDGPVPRRVRVRGRSSRNPDPAVRSADAVRAAVGRAVVADDDLELVGRQGLALEAGE
jgi:hypothetical protein